MIKEIFPKVVMAADSVANVELMGVRRANVQPMLRRDGTKRQQRFPVLNQAVGFWNGLPNLWLKTITC
jgi:hypothetical protein